MHDFLSTYDVKLVEYLIAISFLVSFVGFWRFVNGGAAARQPAVAPHAQPLPALDFRVPEDVLFHPGHAWARLTANLARVGMDDFAQKLVGGISRLELPKVGDQVGQGEKAFRIYVGEKAVDLLSPLDGRVVAVNEKLAASPAALKADPYGEGWLVEVEPARPEANAKGLLSGARARQWMSQVWEELRMRAAGPELGLAMQDGGAPVDGIAQALDPEKWDEIARRQLLS